jgi:hypothetical protein
MTPRPGGFWSEKTNTQPFPKRKLHPVDYVAWAAILIGFAGVGLAIWFNLK